MGIANVIIFLGLQEEKGSRALDSSKRFEGIGANSLAGLVGRSVDRPVSLGQQPDKPYSPASLGQQPESSKSCVWMVLRVSAHSLTDL